MSNFDLCSSFKMYVFQEEDSSPLMVEDLGAEAVEEAPQEGEEAEEGGAAEEALEEGRGSWLNHTDMKVFSTPVFSCSGLLFGCIQ